MRRGPFPGAGGGGAFGIVAALVLILGVADGPALAVTPASTPRWIDPESLEKENAIALSAFQGAAVAEVGPNDTCPGQGVSCGDLVDAAIDTAGDVDNYAFSAQAGTCLSIFTDRSIGGPSTTDTYLELYDADCATRLAFDDDSGSGLFSWIANFPAPYTGTYVVRVRHLSSTGAGAYRLGISCHSGAPANSICAGALPIPCGLFTDQGATYCAGNDLSLPAGASAGCTGFSSEGEDVVYSLTVPAGSVIHAVYASEADGSVYILSDCASADSCLVGSDAHLAGSHEILDYTFPAEGTYYLVLDTFGAHSAGAYTLTVDLNCQGVPVRPTTWGDIKSRFGD